MLFQLVFRGFIPPAPPPEQRSDTSAFPRRVTKSSICFYWSTVRSAGFKAQYINLDIDTRSPNLKIATVKYQLLFYFCSLNNLFGRKAWEDRSCLSELERNKQEIVLSTSAFTHTGWQVKKWELHWCSSMFRSSACFWNHLTYLNIWLKSKGMNGWF